MTQEAQDAFPLEPKTSKDFAEFIFSAVSAEVRQYCGITAPADGGVVDVTDISAQWNEGEKRIRIRKAIGALRRYIAIYVCV